MANQGYVLLGTLGCVVVGVFVIWGGIELFLKTPGPAERKARKAKSFPSGPRQPTPQEQQTYANIQTLVNLFVSIMKKSGLPALSSVRSQPFNPDNVMRRQSPGNLTVPIEITIEDRAWWSGYSCITPAGQWEYHGKCESYREGTMDEFFPWWVVSSRYFKQSALPRDPYPFVMYQVLDSQTATLDHAFSFMADMMLKILRANQPSRVYEFEELYQQLS